MQIMGYKNGSSNGKEKTEITLDSLTLECLIGRLRFIKGNGGEHGNEDEKGEKMNGRVAKE